jgi:hypothetical protein
VRRSLPARGNLESGYDSSVHSDFDGGRLEGAPSARPRSCGHWAEECHAGRRALEAGTLLFITPGAATLPVCLGECRGGAVNEPAVRALTDPAPADPAPADPAPAELDRLRTTPSGQCGSGRIDVPPRGPWNGPCRRSAQRPSPVLGTSPVLRMNPVLRPATGLKLSELRPTRSARGRLRRAALLRDSAKRRSAAPDRRLGARCDPIPRSASGRRTGVWIRSYCCQPSAITKGRGRQ